MTQSSPDDPESHPQPAPELDGLDPRDLLHAGLETIPAMANPSQTDGLDATIPVLRPKSAQASTPQIEIPLPDELTALLPHGAYVVESFVGHGGMGAVYKGTQVRLKRPVAIKIMRRDVGQDHDFEARFEREAQAMGRLNHPNIVSVIDYGEAGPEYLYIVMEVVVGADLMDVIRTGRMTQEMALALLPQICDALQFAHDHGIVHRDIKPSNIMLTRDGRIKIADFGLAKRHDSDGEFQTQTGTGMGTPDYAAPEQFDPNAQIDHRADIYALGVMIYQMITGKLPRGVWKPPSQRAEIHPQWDDIVSHAMQADPKDRYQSAMEVKTDVSNIPLPKGGADGLPSVVEAPAATGHARAALARASTPPKSRAQLLIGIVTGVIALAVGAFIALRPKLEQAGGSLASATGLAPLDANSPAVRQTLDLIALVDVQRDRLRADGMAGANQWTKQDGQLAFASIDKRAGKISAPVALDALRDYEIEVGVRQALTSTMVLDFPISATNQATVAFEPGEVVLVRDEKQKLQPIGKWPKNDGGPPWKLVTRVKLDADGMNGTLSATINGQFVGEWRGALGRLGRRTEPHPDFPGQLVPALYVPSGDRAYSSWTLRVFAGKAKVLRGELPAVIAMCGAPAFSSFVSGASWQSRAIEAGNAGTHSDSTEKLTNGAIRVRFRVQREKSTLVLMLRRAKASGYSPCCLVTLGSLPSAHGVLSVVDAQASIPPRTIGTFADQSPLRAGEEHTAELYAIGDRITAFLDGKQRGSAEDATFTEGFSAVNAPGGIGLISVETADLSAAASPVIAMTATESPQTFAGHRYQVVPGALSWPEAKAKAEAMGGHLATITSKEESGWVSSTFGARLEGSYRSSSIWLGASAEATVQPFRWITGEPFTFTDWHSNEPDYTTTTGKPVTGPFAISLKSRDGQLRWFDDPVGRANANAGFIVEWDR